MAEADPRSRVELLGQLGMLGLEAWAEHDGCAAWRAAVREAPDLILMAARMPGSDGYETARRIRCWEAEQGVRRIPIIALLAPGDIPFRQRCMDSGMDAVLPKPSHAGELQAVLQAWLEQPWPSSPEPIEPPASPMRIGYAGRSIYTEAVPLVERIRAIREPVPMARLRVMLLDDHETMRRGLQLLLEQDYSLDVVGSFRTGRELLAALEDMSADVILCDYALGQADIDGLSLVRRLKRGKRQQARILVMSAQLDPGTAALVMRAGANGFVGKSQAPADLFLAIRTVASGRTYLCRQLAQAIDPVAVPSVEAGDEGLGHARLSAREREVLRCLLDGLPVTAIAARFSRAVTTVSAQKNAAFRKLGIRTDSELFKLRWRWDKP